MTGIAFAGVRGVRSVEVSVDGGKSWGSCRLVRGGDPNVWALWRFRWQEPSEGRRSLLVRSVDGTRAEQTAQVTETFPDGATGYDGEQVRVQESRTTAEEAAMIHVKSSGDDTYQVTVEDGGTRSEHSVTLREDYYDELTGGKISPEELIRKSFEFLLQREPKESILSSFDLPVIQRYFPEYEERIRGG